MKYGKCATDGTFYPDTEVQRLADCVTYIFDDAVEGQFIWNFRTELEPRWSYIEAYDKGWLNKSARKARTFLE